MITSLNHHQGGEARFHLDTLGEKGLFYDDVGSLVQILLTFDRTTAGAQPGALDWNAYRAFEPARVMPLFRTTFLYGSGVGSTDAQPLETLAGGTS